MYVLGMYAHISYATFQYVLMRTFKYQAICLRGAMFRNLRAAIQGKKMACCHSRAHLPWPS